MVQFWWSYDWKNPFSKIPLMGRYLMWLQLLYEWKWGMRVWQFLQVHKLICGTHFFATNHLFLVHFCLKKSLFIHYIYVWYTIGIVISRAFSLNQSFPKSMVQAIYNITTTITFAPLNNWSLVSNRRHDEQYSTYYHYIITWFLTFK